MLLAIGTLLPIFLIVAVFWFLADILPRLRFHSACHLPVELTDFVGRWLHLPRPSLFSLVLLLALADPLAAVVPVLIQAIYIKDILGEREATRDSGR